MAITNCAVVRDIDGYVENTIVADPLVDIAPSNAQLIEIPAETVCSIGYYYLSGGFVKIE